MFGVDELGMDLGTSTLHIVVRGKGIVLSEPAYVAYDRQTRNVVAVGEEARRMYGRTPAGLIVERPLRDGRIRSFDLVSKMLRYFHAQGHRQARDVPPEAAAGSARRHGAQRAADAGGRARRCGRAQRCAGG